MGYREIVDDTMTGIPLPMWYDTKFSHFSDRPTYQQRKDEHHTFYPRAILENGDAADGALRACRVQRGPRWDHDLWHQIYGRPELPKRELRQFGLVVLCAAGYIPDRAISFNQAGVPRTVALGAEQRSLLWSPRRIHVENMPVVRRYLLEYVVASGLDIDSARTNINEFLAAKDVEDRLVMGQCLIEQACQEATSQERMSPLKLVYGEAVAHRRLPQHRPLEVSNCLYTLVAEEQGRHDMEPVAWLGDILMAQVA